MDTNDLEEIKEKLDVIAARHKFGNQQLERINSSLTQIGWVLLAILAIILSNRFFNYF
ncbi:MAG: hypothetical protein HKP55_08380 [Gammaproteobacteria bacterium]|nr:hypothetical protein [Gammaproteobacteria bacterium]